MLFVKNLAAAVIWAVPLVLVGAIEAGMATAHLATFGVVFLGVLAVEAMWDVRDLTGDRKFKIKTLPNVLGVNVTKLISLCYLVAAAFVVWAYGLPTNLAIGIGLLGVYVAEVHEERTPAFYHFFMVFWVVIMTLLLL